MILSRWRGTLSQYAGRLHRIHDSRKEVVIYDKLCFWGNFRISEENAGYFLQMLTIC